MGGNQSVKGFVNHLKGVWLYPQWNGKALRAVRYVIHMVRRGENMTEWNARTKLDKGTRLKTVDRTETCQCLFHKVPAVWGRGGS